MERTPRRVAIVIFCEATGYDDADAAAGARLALGDALRLAHEVNEIQHDDAQALVGQTGEPTCAHCGAPARLTSKGLVWAHVACETWTPKKGQRRCSGSGLAPRGPDGLIVGYTREDGLDVFVRVKDIDEIGMAAGNGYAVDPPDGQGVPMRTAR